MASASTRKHCANGDGCKQSGVAHCEGCSQMFCGKHFIDHRRLLGEELNVIFSNCNEIKDVLNQQTVSDTHPSIKEIDEWEKKSIATIQERANELRQQLLQSGAGHRNELSQKLRQLSEQSNEALEHDSFTETDLRQWKKILEDLKTDLASPPTISIHSDDNLLLVQNIFVHLIKVTKDIFERVSDDNVRIGENGQVVSFSGTSNNHREIRGRNEYASGSHQIRLYIEEFSNTWMLLGINSKSIPLHNESYQCRSAYGWASNNMIWAYGQEKRNHSEIDIEIKKGDVISLILDCDSRTVTMVNERTNMKHELLVNIIYCPLPWQLHVNLSEPNSRVRILSN